MQTPNTNTHVYTREEGDDGDDIFYILSPEHLKHTLVLDPLSSFQYTIMDNKEMKLEGKVAEYGKKLI